MSAQRKQGITIVIVTVWTFLALAVSAMAQLGTAPDATANGPLVVRHAEYKFHRGINADIITGRETELWGVVWHPVDLTQSGPNGFPVIIFLHGNHATCGIGSNPRMDTNCQYSFTGTCPGGFAITPNHLGYEYLAAKLASWGYFVVSINANLGINCRNDGPAGDTFLNLTRGRLLLKHLSLLSDWNTVSNNASTLIDLPPNALIGKLDLQQVGLMGHSRGGEGVRAAYNLYRDVGSPWPMAIFGGATFRAIFEIGPVDGQTGRVLNADGATWNVLLPMCDGDVSNLQGVKPFDRMMNITGENPNRQKSTYTVWGTNHNYYNTEWQTSDSAGCQGVGNPALFSSGPGITGSANQRRQGEVALLAFFRGNIPSPVPNAFNPAFNRNFNTQYAVVPGLPSRVDRAFTYTPSVNQTMALDDFTGAATRTATGSTFSIGTVPNHDATPAGVRAGLISWTAAGGNFQTVFGSRNLTGFLTLEMRVSRQCATSACAAVHPLNVMPTTSFSVQLLNGIGQPTGSAVPLSTYTNLTGPVGGVVGGLHPILQTARIRLSDFTGAALSTIGGVRLVFNGTSTGAIYLANIRVANRSGSGATGEDYYEDPIDYVTQDTVEIVDNNATNIINSIRTVESSQLFDNQSAVEIELLSTRDFEPKNEMIILKIGEQEFEWSRYPEDGDLHSVIFRLTADQFDQIADGEEVLVQYGRGNGYDVRSFGRLDKSMLDQ